MRCYGIVEVAAAPLGLPSGVLGIITKANLAQDRWWRRLSPMRHGSILSFRNPDMAAQRTLDYIDSEKTKAIALAKSGDLLASLKHLGHALHSSEDNIAHEAYRTLLKTVSHFALLSGHRNNDKNPSAFDRRWMELSSRAIIMEYWDSLTPGQQSFLKSECGGRFLKKLDRGHLSKGIPSALGYMGAPITWCVDGVCNYR